MKRFLIVLVLIIPVMSFSQVVINKYVPKVVDGPPRRELKYKWPYFDHIPPFIGVIVGYEGFKSNYYEVGLAANFLRDRRITSGGMAGGQLIYKRHFRENIQSYEAEIGWYRLISIGINANYHVGEDRSTFAVKPFIGLCLYNFQVSWGYNFYSNKNNEISSLRHSNFQMKYVIPIIPFKGKYTRYVYDDYGYYSRNVRTNVSGTPSF